MLSNLKTAKLDHKTTVLVLNEATMVAPTSAPPTSNYTAGFTGSVKEIPEPINLPVRGTIPKWLNGAVYRVRCWYRARYALRVVVLTLRDPLITHSGMC